MQSPRHQQTHAAVWRSPSHPPAPGPRPSQRLSPSPPPSPTPRAKLMMAPTHVLMQAPTPRTPPRLSLRCDPTVSGLQGSATCRELIFALLCALTQHVVRHGNVTQCRSGQRKLNPTFQVSCRKCSQHKKKYCLQTQKLSGVGVQAFATAWAGAISCGPDCYVGVDDASKSIGHVLATASASAFSAVCAGALPRPLCCTQRSVCHDMRSLFRIATVTPHFSMKRCCEYDVIVLYE